MTTRKVSGPKLRQALEKFGSLAKALEELQEDRLSLEKDNNLLRQMNSRVKSRIDRLFATNKELDDLTCPSPECACPTRAPTQNVTRAQYAQTVTVATAGGIFSDIPQGRLQNWGFLSLARLYPSAGYWHVMTSPPGGTVDDPRPNHIPDAVKQNDELLSSRITD